MDILYLELGTIQLHFTRDKPILIRNSKHCQEANIIIEGLKILLSSDYTDEIIVSEFLDKMNIEEVKIILSDGSKEFCAFRNKADLGIITCSTEKSHVFKKLSVESFHDSLIGIGDIENQFMEMTENISEEKNFLNIFCSIINEQSIFNTVCDKFEYFQEKYGENKCSEKLKRILKNAVYICDDIEKTKRPDHFKMFLQLVEHINLIFSEITDNIYNVKFLIHSDNIDENFYVSVNDKLHEKFLSDVATLIINNIDKQEILWTNAQPYIKCLLKVACKIAIAKICKIKLLFLENLREIEEKEKIFFLEDTVIKNANFTDDELARYTFRNFMFRICEISRKLNILLIIKYNCVPVEISANIVICKKIGDKLQFEVIEKMDYNEII